MSSLLKSVGAIWESTPALCALIPFSRVFTGRIPSTTQYKFPFVSILATQGSQNIRSDKTRYSHGPLSFHVWVDDAALEFGEVVAEEITKTYADRTWTLSSTAKVIDCLDEGEPTAHQTDLPNIKAWEVVKLFTVCLMRDRVDHSGEAYSGEDETYSGQ
jgi:hypothetical protein